MPVPACTSKKLIQSEVGLNPFMPVPAKSTWLFWLYLYDTGELGYDGALYDGFLHMTDDMLGPSLVHIKYSSYVYDGFCIWWTNFPGPIESVISKFTCISNVLKIFEGEMFTRTPSITLLQIFCKFVLYSKTLFNKLSSCDKSSWHLSSIWKPYLALFFILSKENATIWLFSWFPY